jgi:hypothetical protein
LHAGPNGTPKSARLGGLEQLLAGPPEAAASSQPPFAFFADSCRGRSGSMKAPDYHVEVDDQYYSVPFALLRETVDARFTDSTIEVFHKGKRIASHMRSLIAHKHTTIPEHMPSNHRRHAE